ncbi:MAG: hypothetical protein R2854_20510 [Caldilineaceae bacterium]
MGRHRPGEAQDEAAHTGVFASHYDGAPHRALDQGRDLVAHRRRHGEIP